MRSCLAGLYVWLSVYAAAAPALLFLVFFVPVLRGELKKEHELTKAWERDRDDHRHHHEPTHDDTQGADAGEHRGIISQFC